MPHALGIEVVAEGGENAEQLVVLRALSCNEVQGYLDKRLAMKYRALRDSPFAFLRGTCHLFFIAWPMQPPQPNWERASSRTARYLSISGTI